MRIVRELLARALVAALGMPVLLLCAYWGGWLLLVLVALLTVVALGEYYSAMLRTKIHPPVLLGYLAALALLAVAAYLPPAQRDLWTPAILMATVAGALLSQFGARSYQGTAVNAAVGVFGVVYVGLLMSFILRLGSLDLPAALGYPSGPLAGHIGALLLVVLPVWTLDTFAFVVGSAWGRHPLCSQLSPRKTMEGAAAGLVGCTAFTALLGWWLHLPLVYSVPLGVLLGVMSQLGDAAKSTIKRDLGIKDFGNFFGPHGGILDRFDGLLFAMPVAWFYLTFVLAA